MSGSNPDPIALNFHESLLRVSDVQLLQGPHWLNDKIISFYFEYLEKVKYKMNSDMLFVSPEVTQCIKIVPDEDINIFLSPLEAETKPFIFFALNDNESHRAGGSHWSLLVFSRPERAFFHCDSFDSANFSNCQLFVNKIKSHIRCQNAILKPMHCLQQSNSYDCGIHVLCMVDNISDHINTYELLYGVGPLNHDIISRKRGDILKIIVQLNGKIGIIGGSGLDDPDILEKRTETFVSTPYGEPSDVIIQGQIKGISCALLARHGRGHSIMPSNVNYRANIWALKSLECTHVIVSTATGSLREDMKPGDLIVPHDFIDRTTKRAQTFYDGKESSPKGVCHLPMSPSFCPKTREILIKTAKQLGLSVHTEATIISIEGPRFSSRAESHMFRSWGADLINMTTCPEVVLAKEAGLHYGAVAIATDYDCWKERESVCVADVLKVFGQNVSKVKDILVTAVENIAKQDWTEDILQMKKHVTDNVMLTHKK